MTGIFAAAAVQFPAAPEAVIALVGARYAIFHVNIRGFQIEASIGALGCGASEIADAMVAPFVGKAVSIPIFAGCGSAFLKVVRFDSVVSDVMRFIVELITDKIGVALRAAIGFYIFNGYAVRAIRARTELRLFGSEGVISL